MSEQKKYFITGGTGKVGKRIAEKLRAQGHIAIQGSRNPKGDGHVKFDYSDSSNFADLVKGIDGIYIVSPHQVDQGEKQMFPLVEAALKEGVKRFVIIGGFGMPIQAPWGPAIVWKYLAEEKKDVEYVVLNNGWMCQNFWEGSLSGTIKSKQTIYSGSGDAKVAWTDAEDIAACGAAALTLPEGSDKLNRAYDITGSKAYSQKEVAEIISKASGKEIKCVDASIEEIGKELLATGLPQGYAFMLAKSSTDLGDGSNGVVADPDSVKVLTGKDANNFEQFAASVDWNQVGPHETLLR